MSIKTLILTGEGINCEVETAHAFDKAGGTSTIMHLHDFLLLPSLDEYDILAFPGGFSFGDEIRSGKIVAELIKLHQFEALKKFINNGKPVLGICNGFQILTQLGVFNDFEQGSFTLSQNVKGKFIDKWVKLKQQENNSLWLKDLPNELFMPVRHKEGRIIGNIPKEQILLKYENDINGSDSLIAAVSNKRGNVLGLMPHPEAGIHPFLLPEHKEKAISNLQIFKNAVQYSLQNSNKGNNS